MAQRATLMHLDERTILSSLHESERMEQLEERTPGEHEEEKPILIIRSQHGREAEKQKRLDDVSPFVMVATYQQVTSKSRTNSSQKSVCTDSPFNKTPFTEGFQETRNAIHITNSTSTAILSEMIFGEAPSPYTMGWFSMSMDPVMTREKGYIGRAFHSHLCFCFQSMCIHVDSDIGIPVSLAWKCIWGDCNDFHVVLSIEGVQTTFGACAQIHLFG